MTGYGILEIQQRSITYIASGRIVSRNGELPERLGTIYSGLSKVIAEYRPTIAAIESIFMAKNASSALKLGQARGVAIAAAVAEEAGTYPAGLADW